MKVRQGVQHAGRSEKTSEKTRAPRGHAQIQTAAIGQREKREPRGAIEGCRQESHFALLGSFQLMEPGHGLSVLESTAPSWLRGFRHVPAGCLLLGSERRYGHHH